jgi:hypothetical protein
MKLLFAPCLHVILEAIHQLANRSMEDALRSFEVVLKAKPTNLIALLGKVRRLCSWSVLVLITS